MDSSHPLGKSGADAGAGQRAITGDVIDQAHLQRGLFDGAGENDPGFDLRGARLKDPLGPAADRRLVL